jgi:hypothetical protein
LTLIFGNGVLAGPIVTFAPLNGSKFALWHGQINFLLDGEYSTVQP